VGDDKFIVYLGDNVLRKSLTDYTKKFSSSGLDAMILLCEVDNPSKFGVAYIDKEDSLKIKNIIEKPKNPTSNLAVIGVYFLSPKIFDIIDNLKPSMRGELEITDALQLLMDKGNTIAYDTVTGWWKDTGTPDDIIHANRLILDSIGTEEQFLAEKDASIKDNIIIGKDTEISQDSSIIGPSIIGKNCKIGNAVRLGPYVSIGDNCILENCHIENSILMKDCKVYAKVNLSSSIIAHNSQIEGGHDVITKSQFLLGERTYLKL
jgi:glucose-1-phosphate thymidylyltransferase